MLVCLAYSHSRCPQDKFIGVELLHSVGRPQGHAATPLFRKPAYLHRNNIGEDKLPTLSTIPGSNAFVYGIKIYIFHIHVFLKARCITIE